MRAETVEVLLVMAERVVGDFWLRVDREKLTDAWLAFDLADEEHGHLVIGHPASFRSSVETANREEPLERESCLFLDDTLDPLIIRLATDDVPTRHVPALLVRVLATPHENFLDTVTLTHERLLGRREWSDRKIALECRRSCATPADLLLEREVLLELLRSELCHLRLRRPRFVHLLSLFLSAFFSLPSFQVSAHIHTTLS